MRTMKNKFEELSGRKGRVIILSKISRPEEV